jgi:hypothetical protein
VIAAAFDLEAMIPQCGEGALEVGDHDRDVAALRHGWRLGGHQVDLSSAAFQPGELAKRLGWLDQ